MKLALDPRTKLFILVLVNILVFTSPDLASELVCMGVITALFMVMGLGARIAVFPALYGFIAGVQYLLGFFPGSFFSGLVSMLIICLRKILPVTFFASGLIATTKVSELICAMQKMGIPKSIVIPFAVTLRFFPTAREEFSHIRDAMRLRGIGFSVTNILTRPLPVLEWILIPMMLRCASIADELSAAAAVRGIDSGKRRTSLHTLKIQPADIIAAGIFSFITFRAVTGKGGVFS